MRRSSRKPAPPRKKACKACTRSKVRCNLARPACSRCRSSGRNCEYPATSPENVLVDRNDVPPHSELRVPEIASSPFPTAQLDLGPDMPGIPLPLGSPTVSWHSSPRPRQSASLRRQGQERTTELDFRDIGLEPSFNADDIRDRWLRPYILPSLGREEVPKVYNLFTLQYISRVLRAYPLQMLKDGQTPPIIHHTQVDSPVVPRPLANCYTLVRMYEQAVPGSEAMVVSTIERELDRLAQEPSNQDDYTLLSIFQAYLIYAIMLYFAPITTEPSVTDKIMITLMDLAYRTARNGLVCAAEAAHTRPTWESWIVAAVKRRAIFTMYLFSSLYNADRLLPNFLAEELRGLYVPGNKALWEAYDRDTWEKEYDRHLSDWEDGMLEISELWRSPETGTSERRRRVERWIAEADEFGMMLFAVCAHIHGC